MKKRVFIISAAIVLTAVMLSSCGKDGKIEENTTVSTAPVEYSTEENGEPYVTNVNGEHIPVTTDKNGMADMYEDLITKTAEQVSREKEEIEKEKETEGETQGEAPVSQGEATTASGSVVVGDKNDASRDAVIDLT